MEILKRPEIRGGYREHWLDLAKAIGIILVVWAHALPKDNYMWIWINSFHMPLFFCISGYLYSCKGGFLPYAVKKIRTLWVPFEVASFVTYIVFLLIGTQASFSVKEIAKIVLMVAPGPLLGATWFIPVLLFTSILYDLLYRGIRRVGKEKNSVFILTVVSIIFLIVGLITSLPYRGSVILRSVFFFHLGQMMKKYWKSQKYDLVIGIVLMAAVSVAAIFNTTSYLNNTFTSLPLYFVAAIGGSIGICILCRFVCSHIDAEKMKGILYIGMNTMGPLIWQFVTFKIVIALQIIVYHLPWSRLEDFPVIYDYATGLWVLLDIVVGIGISIMIYKLVNKPVDKLAARAEKRLLGGLPKKVVC